VWWRLREREGAECWQKSERNDSIKVNKLGESKAV